MQRKEEQTDASSLASWSSYDKDNDPKLATTQPELAVIFILTSQLDLQAK
jgi:hypothetical protein